MRKLFERTRAAPRFRRTDIGPRRKRPGEWGRRKSARVCSR